MLSQKRILSSHNKPEKSANCPVRSRSKRPEIVELIVIIVVYVVNKKEGRDR